MHWAAIRFIFGTAAAAADGEESKGESGEGILVSVTRLTHRPVVQSMLLVRAWEKKTYT